MTEQQQVDFLSDVARATVQTLAKSALSNGASTETIRQRDYVRSIVVEEMLPPVAHQLDDRAQERIVEAAQNALEEVLGDH